MNKIKLSIVDDHKILREGLCCLFNAVNQIDVISDFSNGEEFVRSLDASAPDIAIVDFCMDGKNGIETVKRAREVLPDLKILILSVYSDKRCYAQVKRLNVDGYVLKSSGFDELKHAILTIANGGNFFSQQLLINLLKTTQTGHPIVLSELEKRILLLMSVGKSTGEIANQLKLSVGSIEKHRSKMLLQTGSANAVRLIVYAVKHNLIMLG